MEKKKKKEKKRHWKIKLSLDLFKVSYILPFSNYSLEESRVMLKCFALGCSLALQTGVWNNQENWTDVLCSSSKELPLHLPAITNFSMLYFSEYYISYNLGLSFIQHRFTPIPDFLFIEKSARQQCNSVSLCDCCTMFPGAKLIIQVNFNEAPWFSCCSTAKMAWGFVTLQEDRSTEWEGKGKILIHYLLHITICRIKILTLFFMFSIQADEEEAF